MVDYKGYHVLQLLYSLHIPYAVIVTVADPEGLRPYNARCIHYTSNAVLRGARALNKNPRWEPKNRPGFTWSRGATWLYYARITTLELLAA